MIVKVFKKGGRLLIIKTGYKILGGYQMQVGISNSPKYQLLISDIKAINEQIRNTTDEEELVQLKEKRSELYSIKSMYSNIEHFAEAVKNV